MDALTPKQGRLIASLANVLKEDGYEVLVTCRDYECTYFSIKLYGLEPVVVGIHGGSTNLGKLVADGERILALSRLVDSFKPHVLISYPNPSASRVAFGLGSKYVAFNDTPHAVAANRLALPLCDALVASEALQGDFDSFLLPGTRVTYYKGVDEAIWVKRFIPKGITARGLNLEERRYVIVRPEEYKAAYYSWEGWSWLELCEELKRKGFSVVVLPRYEEQRLAALKRGFTVPSSCIDGMDLTYYAAAVVTGGGTMAREAALLGVPSYYMFPLELKVSNLVSAIGFPLKRWRGSPRELAEEIASIEISEIEESILKAKSLLDKIETPEKILAGILTDLLGSN